MRRVSRGKNKKSEANSDGEEEITSVQADNDETGSNNDADTSNAATKKRNARGRVKASEENHDEEKEETAEKQENGKPPSKKRKKESDEGLENDKEESDEEEKPVAKNKKKGKQEKEVDESVDEIKKAESEENGKSPAKSKGKKGKAAQKVEETEEADDGEEYEVEKIVDQRTIKGRRQFLVRWKGYAAEHDTWEQEKELNCDRLIEEFLAEQEENGNEKDEEDEKEKPEKSKTKAKKQDKKAKKQKRTSKAKSDDSKGGEDNGDVGESDESKEYEVEKIIEVHFRKDKTREFLIRWKGFSSKEDTWEPEANLSCPGLIEKFMEKLEKIKETDSRDLRTNPSHTKRYTLTMHADKRQSRRHADKQRVTYHECD